MKTLSSTILALVYTASNELHRLVADFEDLYSPDGSHPSISGSYLAACVIFTSLTGTSPVRLASGPDELEADQRLQLQQTTAAIVFGAGAPDRWTR